MADAIFNTQPGVTVARELLLACLNTGTAISPVWAKVGKRVEDSSMEFDWQTENKTDIFGDIYATGKKAIRTQTFDPCELDSEDEAQQKIWKLAVRDNDVNQLLNQDMLIIHLYAGGTEPGNGNFAERYASCSVLPSGLGGGGGGSVGMPIDVTYGGTRTLGTASIDAAGVIAFTPDSDELEE